MTAGTKIFWKGDFSNEPRHGIVLAVTNGMVSIRWDNGTEAKIPSFTINERYGWKIG